MQSNPSHPQVESNTVSESRARLMEELNKSEEDRWRERAENAARARKQRSGVCALISFKVAQGIGLQGIRIFLQVWSSTVCLIQPPSQWGHCFYQRIHVCWPLCIRDQLAWFQLCASAEPALTRLEWW